MVELLDIIYYFYYWYIMSLSKISTNKYQLKKN